MAVLAVAVFGALAVRELQVELLPDLSHPTLTVRTEHVDAAPLSIEQFVTRPIEEAVGVIPGVREMRSASRAGLSEVTLQFDWGEDMDVTALEVREKLGLVELPRDAERSRVLRFDPSLDPILRVAFSGDRPLEELRQLAERLLKPKIESIRGVAAARVRGGLEPEVQVEADEKRLAALGLTLDDLGRALRQANVNLPGGTLRDYGTLYLVRTLNEFVDIEQLERTVVRDGPEGRVLVGEVAEVRLGHRDRQEVTRSAGDEVVELAIHREGAANTVAVAAEVRAELDRLQGELADDLTLTVLADQSRFVSAAIRQVQVAALLGGLLAILVLYFFLRQLRPTLLIALSIPASLLATFLGLRQFGVTLNVMSLGGLALGIGMLLDNSIVVLEAIDRRRRAGDSNAEAASRGGGEVASAVTAATLTTVCVFLPVVFVEGIAGQLFSDLAITVCLCLVASLFVSLTLIPAVAGLGSDPTGVLSDAASLGPRAWLKRLSDFVLGRDRTLDSDGDTPPGRWRRFLHWLRVVLFFPVRLVLAILALVVGLVAALLTRAWQLIAWLFEVVSWPLLSVVDGIGRLYPRLLRSALAHGGLVVLVAFLGLLACWPLARDLGTNLVPPLARGEFGLRLRLPAGTPLEVTAEHVERLEEGLIADGRFAAVFSSVGALPATASGLPTTGENLAQVDLALPPGSTSVDEADAVARCRELLGLFPDIEVELVRPTILSLSPPVAIDVLADDLEVLDAATERVAAALSELPELADVSTTLEPGHPELRVRLDRDRAAAMGLSAEALGQTLRRQLRGEVLGQLRQDEERIDIRLRSHESGRDRIGEVGALRMRTSTGESVPVSALAQVELGQGPAAIHRFENSRAARVSAKVPAVDLASALATVRETLDEVRPELPGGAVAELSGQEKDMKTSFDSLRLALALAVFLVLVVMAMQFESLKQPFVILLSVPLGAIGVVLTLVLLGRNIDVFVLLGVVMLAGIVVNNAIVLVDAVSRRRREGQALDAALEAAGGERLRPILMTTATTVLGLLPMALGLGEGDELRAPLAITVIGGLTGSTVLTLLVIPCLYRLVNARAERRRVAALAEQAAEVTS